MNKHVDFYKTLQVHHDAGQDIIDAAYRCLSKMYHPDVNKSPLAVERMKDINIAYGVIGDGRRRREYHIEWMKHNAVKPLTSTVLNREQKQNTAPDPVKEAKRKRKRRLEFWTNSFVRQSTKDGKRLIRSLRKSIRTTFRWKTFWNGRRLFPRFIS